MCLKRTGQNNALGEVLKQLRELAKECRSEGPRLDFSNFVDVINRYIKQLNSVEEAKQKLVSKGK